jgi:uncharacterized protein (DUF2237 family)
MCLSIVNKDQAINVLGEPLQPCGMDPLTGFYRDGCCNTSTDDVGCHTVCVLLTEEFLNYTRFQGNDLSTPRPEVGFQGLSEGDCWCLCASRWAEAYEHGVAPKVYLERTHIKTLEIIDLEVLQLHAAIVH